MDGMDESLYGEDKPSAPQNRPDSVDEESEDQATDLMSKTSFPGGCKVGDKYEIEITGDHGEEFSVKVVKPDEESKEKPEAESGEDPELAQVNSSY